MLCDRNCMCVCVYVYVSTELLNMMHHCNMSIDGLEVSGTRLEFKRF